MLQQEVRGHLALRARKVAAFRMKFQPGRAGNGFHRGMVHRLNIAYEAFVIETGMDESDEFDR